MTKTVSVTIDIEVARSMLRCAGFSTYGATDDEVFAKVLSIIDCYGATCEIQTEEENKK
jgi:hypothetical protein